MALLSSILVACKQEAGEPTAGRQPVANQPDGLAPTAIPSVADLLADPLRLHTLMERCRNDPGRLGRTPECINAAEARKQQTADEMKRAVQ